MAFRLIANLATLLGAQSPSGGQILHRLGARGISTTNVLNAEPPKKKRRVDPLVLKTRVERKIKKYEREIDKLESAPKQAIPILEYQLTNSELRDLKSRPGRSLEDVGLSVGSIRAAQRLWTFYRAEQSKMEWRSIKRVERAQTRALDTLRQVDESLYDKTVQVDELTLIPYATSHMRRESPPKANYQPPDGSIKDVSREWVM